MQVLCKPSHRMSRGGFTLVELLVVIAIIGILIAMLLPAVQAAREAARRLQCADNLKQMGIAAHCYHDAIGSFPMGLAMWGTNNTCAMPPNPVNIYYPGFGWGAFLLPYMEQIQVYDQIDFDVPSYGIGVNYDVAANFIPVYLCPSDPQGKELVNCCGSTHGTHDYEDVARTNYAGVADSRDWTCDGSYLRRDADGIMFNLSRVKISEVTDGTSNTLLVGEIPGFDSGSFDGFFWISWDVMSTQNGINLPLRLGSQANSWHVDAYGFGSHHPGGCHFLYADGSTHFITEDMSQDILESLTTRAGGEIIDETIQ